MRGVVVLAIKMGNIASNIYRLVNLKEENNQVSICGDYTYSDVPVLIPDSNIELSLSDIKCKSLEIFEIGENDSVTPPLNDQPLKATVAIMPKVRSKPRPKPKPRSVQLRERELMNSDESLSQNTFNEVNDIIKSLPNQPSPLPNFDSSTDEDSDYTADRNEAQNVKETKTIIEEPMELSIPRTIALDRDGQPIIEKCNCYFHQRRNVFNRLDNQQTKF